MNNNKKNIILQIILLAFLLFTLFESNIVSRWGIAIFLFVFMIISKFALKKRKILSMYTKEVCILMLIFATIYLAGFYLLGIHFGFYKSTITLSFWSLLHYIIPTAIIIISSELIRFIFLSQKSKASQAMMFISMVLIDLIVYVNIYNITTLDELLRAVGYIFFASVSCNLLYNYITNRYGYKPTIIYRLITSLYVYIIPIIPNLYIFFKSAIRIIFPYIIYLVLEYTYSKNTNLSTYKERKKNIITTTIAIAISIIVIMLVSCKFLYGLLVVGSGSMTGTINKGDVAFFKAYRKDDKVKEGQVIVFKKGDLKVIHRVIDKKIVNGKFRYITKGDANQQKDDGYIEDKDVIGIVKYKIKYIGYPTIWVNELFEK